MAVVAKTPRVKAKRRTKLETRLRRAERILVILRDIVRMARSLVVELVLLWGMISILFLH